ncbi:MAG: TetR/AcrR family transcriptional regulator [Proteobacteria bacterium]|nr:TetR/AcrR family transcriptional regulator [Pseudomonadota bacterium]
MVQKEPKEPNTPRKPRGRPRAYDPEQALARVMDAFWHTGYSGTSLDQLSAATGMNRPSLYGAFGDKRALYLTTIDRYIAGGQQGMEQALRYDLPLEKALIELYERALALYLPEGEPARGCFLVATAGTEAVADAEVRAKLGDALRGVDRAFEARLRHAQKQGELDPAADPALLARIATGVLHTLAVRSRAGDARAALRATANGAVVLICANKPAKTRRR